MSYNDAITGEEMLLGLVNKFNNLSSPLSLNQVSFGLPSLVSGGVANTNTQIQMFGIPYLGIRDNIKLLYNRVDLSEYDQKLNWNTPPAVVTQQDVIDFLKSVWVYYPDVILSDPELDSGTGLNFIDVTAKPDSLVYIGSSRIWYSSSATVRLEEDGTVRLDEDGNVRYIDG